MTPAGRVCNMPAARADPGAAEIRRGTSEGPEGQLPPDILADPQLLRAEQAVRDGNAPTAHEAMEQVASLQAARGLEPAPEKLYRHARAWAAAGEPDRAVEAALPGLEV